ncbi:YndM family protein [Niallia oryzisoli]|uniref:YndM family protein n=1 Tax=Niallia oryzisoli TaxID=1737571 RepID=A0ABZ2CPD4_9BACI
MKHLWALLIKLAAVGTVVLSIYGIFNADLFTLVMMSLVITLVSYVIGDMFILRRMGNFAASLGDFVLSFGLLWVMSFLFIDANVNRLSASLISAFSIAVIEAIFHMYVKKHIFSDSADSYIPSVTRRDRFATEFSEELDVRNENQNKNDQ